jgi:hypothetical protein
MSFAECPGRSAARAAIYPETKVDHALGLFEAERAMHRMGVDIVER